MAKALSRARAAAEPTHYPANALGVAMFNQKPYFEVNREERHYCFLLAHSILSSQEFCTQFNYLISSKTNRNIGNEVPDVYLEAATLRDYWRDLGDPTTYSEETHEHRRRVINQILKIIGYPDINIEKYDLFWTTQAHEKLWSPGRWSDRAIKASGLSKLQRIKWAFNAKPDILLDYDSLVVLIEAKVESPIGRTRKGYEQTKIHKLIGELLHRLVPYYGNKDFKFLMISNKEDYGIYWKEIATIGKLSDLDLYTKKSISTWL